MFLNRERVQDSYSDPISLVRESVIVSVQGTAGLGSPPLLGHSPRLQPLHPFLLTTNVSQQIGESREHVDAVHVRQARCVQAKRVLYAKLATALFPKALRQVVDSTVGDVVQLVRILHCHGVAPRESSASALTSPLHYIPNRFVQSLLAVFDVIRFSFGR